MRKLSAEIGRPVTFGMNQVEDDPEQWRMLLAESLEACGDGSQCYPQVAGRPFGMLIGLQTHHAFAKRPTFMALAHLPLPELVARLREPAGAGGDPGRREPPHQPSVVWDELPAALERFVYRLYPMGPGLDYEPLARAFPGQAGSGQGRRARSSCSTTSCSRTKAAP